MKKLLATLTLLFVAINISIAQEVKSNKPKITFEKEVHDFGTFKESDGPVTCVFKFKNTGDGLLVINQAIANCGCTTPIFPKEPIKPNEGGEIKITYNGKGKRAGEFEKKIIIRANTEQQIHRLTIKGSMIVSIR